MLKEPFWDLRSKDLDPNIKFFDFYEPVGPDIFYNFYLRGQVIKEHLGIRSKCAFCDKPYSQNEFKNDSHLIPDFLGNQIFFSNEECDECNGKYSNMEYHLAQCLLPYRSIMQIPSRYGFPSWFNKDRGTISRVGTNLQIKTDIIDNPSFQFEPENKRIILKGEGRPFNLNLAVLSILRSAYLRLPSGDRSRFDWLKSMILRKKIDPCNSLFQLFSPSRNMFEVRLQVYWLKKPSKEDLPELVISLWVGNMGFIWWGGKDRPNSILLPPFYTKDISTQPSHTMLSIKDEMTKLSSSSSFVLSFESSKKGGNSSSISSLESNLKSSLGEVELQLLVDNKVSFSRTMFANNLNVGASSHKIKLSHKNFPTHVFLSIKDKDSFNLSFVNKFAGADVLNVLEAINFFNQLSEPSIVIRILFKINGSVVESKGSFKLSLPTFTLEKEISFYCNKLREKFPPLIKFPEKYDTSDVYELALLYEIFVVKFLPSAREIVDIKISDYFNKATLLKNLCRGELTLQCKSKVVTILNKEISIPSFQMQSIQILPIYDGHIADTSSEVRIIQVGKIYSEISWNEVMMSYWDDKFISTPIMD